MKILQLTPGSGDTFYCENCLRDHDLVAALGRLGQEVLTAALYLPLGPDAPPSARAPIFFGAVNVYLQQTSALFRRTPRWLDRLWDGRWLLGRIGRLAGATRAAGLAEATLSMLAGEEGRQVKELNRLTDWLEGNFRPDVVCLSNALLIGLARTLRRRLGAAIVCLLQDEDEFLDALPDAPRRQAWDVLARRCAEADALVASSRYYADEMSRRLGLPPSRLAVAYNALDVRDYSPADAPPDRPTIGFLSRACYGKGPDLLAEAFALVKAEPRLAAAKLRLAGGSTAADRGLIRSIRRRLKQSRLAGDVEFLPNLHRHERIEFLRSLTVLSVPERHGEAAGRYLLEALACGVPVVATRGGACPELIDATGGGILCEPENPPALAEALKSLLLDPPRRQDLGRRGRQAVIEQFGADVVARQMAEILRHAAEARNPDHGRADPPA